MVLIQKRATPINQDWFAFVSHRVTKDHSLSLKVVYLIEIPLNLYLFKSIITLKIFFYLYLKHLWIHILWSSYHLLQNAIIYLDNFLSDGLQLEIPTLVYLKVHLHSWDVFYSKNFLLPLMNSLMFWILHISLMSPNGNLT